MGGVDSISNYNIIILMKKVFLSGKMGRGVYFCVDDEDFERVVKHSWWVDRLGRPQTDIKHKRVLIGRFIMNPPKNMVVDHIDGDVKNNIKSNLRICTQSNNQRNRTVLNRNSTSGHRGVSWDKFRSKWVAQLSLNYRHIYLGRFDKKEDAVEAVRDAIKEKHGKYANYKIL